MHLSIAKLSRFDEFDESDESDESDDGRCGKKLKLYNEVDYDSDDGKKFRLPHILYDPEELLRLMTRKPGMILNILLFFVRAWSSVSLLVSLINMYVLLPLLKVDQLLIFFFSFEPCSRKRNPRLSHLRWRSLGIEMPVPG